MELRSAAIELPKAGATRPRLAQVLTVGAIGGMLAGIMMGVVEMIYAWLSDAHRFWDPLMAIWAWLAGRNYFGAPAHHIGPIILGLGGHMTNAMGAGVVFALLMFYVVKPRSALTPLLLGVGWGLSIWVILRYGVLPLRADAEADLFTTSLVSPAWVWWLAHAMLGLTAGAFFLAARGKISKPSPLTVVPRRSPTAAGRRSSSP